MSAKASAPRKSGFKRQGFASHAVQLGELVLCRVDAALTPFGLKARDYDAMVCIRRGDGLSQQELSCWLGAYAPQMVGLIDGLEKRGLAERRVSGSDRRRHELFLTPAGDDLLDRAAAAAAALEAELFGDISERDRARFRALVERIESGAPPRC